MPLIRADHNDEIYRTAEEKYEAIIKVIETCRQNQQPVLVGTTSIDKSEKLSRLLKQKKIEHNVLNARYHEQEAQIIAQAGKPGAVTIATNMAGRGTDIKLGGNLDMRLQEEIPADADEVTRARLTEKIKKEIADAYQIVKKAGGLYIIGSERHESRRIDNQLRGRAGRQGDPGASKFYISLEDDLMRIFGSEKMDMFLQKMGLKHGQPIIHPWINTAIERAQKKVEQQHFEGRKFILKFDNVMNDQRRVIYDQRKEIMVAEDVSEVIRDMRHEVIDNLVALAIPEGSYAEQWDVQILKTESLRLLGIHIPADDWVKEEGIGEEEIAERIKKLIDDKLAERESAAPAEQLRQIEKNILLWLLDQQWKEHLLNLDYLRQGIMLRAFGQKDPLNEYRTEAFAMFQGMLDSLREKVTSTHCMTELHATQANRPPKLPEPQQPRRTILSRGTDPSVPAGDNNFRPFKAPDFDKDNPETWASTPRNAPCPCGSGKKYKYCHGKAA
jgi:preprotein translocase subunit SecA